MFSQLWELGVNKAEGHVCFAEKPWLKVLFADLL